MADKHIRLDSKFSSIAGFWKPGAPSKVMTGNLTIDDDGIRFITSPKYARGLKVRTPPMGQINLSSTAKTGVLHGFFEEGDCTLLHLPVVEPIGHTAYDEVSQSICSTLYRGTALVSGMHTGAFHHRCIDSARYTFTSLAEWVPKTFNEEWGKEHITIKLPMQEKTLLEFTVDSMRARVELKVRYTLTTDEESKARQIKPVVFIEVTPEKCESLSWFLGTGNRLENLFSLLTGTSVGMETLFIYRGEQNGTIIRKQRSVVRPYEVLEAVRCTSSQLAHAITTWLGESKGFREIERLLLGVLRKSELFIETEFLSLAQALEGFHRATGKEINLGKPAFKDLRKKIEKFLQKQRVDAETAMRVNSAVAYSNQTSFRSRLKELCTRMSAATLAQMQISETETFIGSVVQMRNFFTHAGGSSNARKTPLDGRELFLLSQKMRALLRGVFLLHLGFPEQQIQDLIVREGTKWR